MNEPSRVQLSTDAWARELERKIERNDSRQAFLWTVFASLVTGSWLLLDQSDWLTKRPTTWTLGWILGLATLAYLIAGSKALSAIINGANPPWAKDDLRFQSVILTRYVKRFGPPKAARLVAFGRTVCYSTLGAALWILAQANDGVEVLLLYVLAVNFVWSGILNLVPFFLPKKDLAQKMGTSTAGTFRLLAGNESETTDVDSRLEELRDHQGWSDLRAQAKKMVAVIRIALRANPWFYLAVCLLVFFAGPSRQVLVGELEHLLSLSAGLLLAFMALNFWLHLYVDQSRSLLEQLHYLALTGTISPANVESALFVIEAFRRNHYVLQLPVDRIIAELGAAEINIKDPPLNVDAALKAVSQQV